MQQERRTAIMATPQSYQNKNKHHLPFFSTISTNEQTKRTTSPRKKGHSNNKEDAKNRQKYRPKALSSQCIEYRESQEEEHIRGLHDRTHNDKQKRGIAEREVDLFLRLGLVNHSCSDQKRPKQEFASDDVDMICTKTQEIHQKENRNNEFHQEYDETIFLQIKRVTFIDPLVTKMRQHPPFDQEDLPHLFYSEEELEL